MPVSLILSQLVNSYEGAPLSYGYSEWKVVGLVAIELLHPFVFFTSHAISSIILIYLESQLNAGEYAEMYLHFRG